MKGIIFVETLRRSWKQMIYWGLAIGALGLYMFSALPKAPEDYENFIKVIEEMKPGALQLMGVTDISALMTPEGFIGFAFFGYVLLILAIFAVIAGLNVSAVDEDNGSMDVMLSLPVHRWQVILEKTLAYCVMGLGILFMAFIGLVIGSQTATDRITLPVDKYFTAVVGLVPGVVFMITVTAFIATFMRRRSGAAIAAGSFIVGSYFLNILAGLTNNEFAGNMRYLSFFSYFEATKILTSGWSVVSALVLLLISIGLVGGAITLFKNRDVSVESPKIPKTHRGTHRGMAIMPLFISFWGKFVKIAHDFLMIVGCENPHKC
ncbi:MAG TPA: ABC transporter permease subunit [Aggregatilineales bacterium]|nr:ABC transporter permease subunit [Aggregatilineales bacterium]